MSRVFARSLLTVLCLVVVVGVVAVRAPATREPPAAPANAPAAPAQTSTPCELTEALDLVPAESLLCWYARPFPDTDPTSDEPSALDMLIKWGSVLTRPALNAEARLWARAAEAFGLAIRYPHVAVLIDAHAKPLESNPELKRGDRIRFALIVRTCGENDAFARVIQAAINEQTDQENATRVAREASRWQYVELRDQRLPDWCTIAWGRIDDYFVFAVGPDVWPSIAAVAAGDAESLSRASWLEGARDQRGRDALIEIIVASQEIRSRLDPLVDGRASAFFNAWHADEIERAHWALGFEGRALYCVAHFLRGGKTREFVYANPDIRIPRLLTTIPDDARYAIYQVNPGEAIPSFFSGLLATRSATDRKNVMKLWEQIQAERGFDAQRDILAHLGHFIVMHNDPPHPLRLPLAMTTLTEIAKEPEQVRRTIDNICEAWREEQLRLAEATQQPNVMQVERDSDGVWYLQFGVVAGPAWTVTDRFIITSWSPSALRSYLDKVGDAAGRRPPTSDE